MVVVFLMAYPSLAFASIVFVGVSVWCCGGVCCSLSGWRPVIFGFPFVNHMERGSFADIGHSFYVLFSTMIS